MPCILCVPCFNLCVLSGSVFTCLKSHLKWEKHCSYFPPLFPIFHHVRVWHSGLAKSTLPKNFPSSCNRSTAANVLAPILKLWWWLMLPCSCISGKFCTPLVQPFQIPPQIHGIAITILFISTGALLVCKNDIRNNPHWYGRDTTSISGMQVLLNQSPSEKPNSWKSVCRVQAIYKNHQWQASQGQLLIYFKKDSLPPPPIGTIITITAQPQPITNSGNPGSFDYKRYCLFHGITHQVYLTPENFVADTGASISPPCKNWLNTPGLLY